MKWIILVLILLSSFSWAQEVPNVNPRVAELEEKLAEEASLYFSRRYPGEPFFVKADVTPLRRNTAAVKETENLPYYDQDTEEILDEWDDPSLPLSALRNRVVKVVLNVTVPMSFDDEKVNEIKQDLSIYLKLLSYRDSIVVEKKFKGISKEIPVYVYYFAGVFFVILLMFGAVLAWALRKTTTKEEIGGQNNKPTISQAVSAPAPVKSAPTKTSTSVSGDVTFHDPIKIFDIVHVKLKQISESKTFPTLKDVMLLDELAHRDPWKLGAIICEFPLEWQKQIYMIGRDHSWLEAYCHSGHIDHECLMILEKLSKQRHMISHDRNLEDLLIQIWRLGEKSINFFKSIEQEHAFVLLSIMPKSLSLFIAKKAFPGIWGRLLEKKSTEIILLPQQIQVYYKLACDFFPHYEWKLLEEYKKDNELLTYLSKVTIDDEKDLYETLQPDSFLFKVRPPFYKVFSLNEEQFQKLFPQFAIEKWALVVINSSRGYIKFVMDQLDEKKKIIFSSYLRQLDSRTDLVEEQAHWRREISSVASDLFPELFKNEFSQKKEATNEISSNVA